MTHVVDVTGVLDRKRASMRAHASQIGPEHFMASMPEEAFAFAFGAEWFILDDDSAEPGRSAMVAKLFQPKAERSTL